MNTQKIKVRSIVGLLVTGLLLSASLYVILNRQFVLDTVHYWNFSPSTSVAEIKDKMQLSDNGGFIFYATRPSVENNQTFNDVCQRKEENVAVIGCYVNNRIYIYDVTDTRLNGIKEVTSAHELLHAAYQRLSESDRINVDKLIEVEYNKLATDPSLADRMAFYSRTEPGERNNELHSIIGTEISAINSELERHYSKYFKNRKKVVDLYNSYNRAFTELTNKTNNLSVKIDKLSKKIDNRMILYNSEVSQLNRDIEQFNLKASEGYFTSQSSFTTERQKLQNRISGLAQLRTTIESEVGQYEALRNEYNDTVLQSKELYKSIDSKLEPAPSV